MSEGFLGPLKDSFRASSETGEDHAEPAAGSPASDGSARPRESAVPGAPPVPRAAADSAPPTPGSAPPGPPLRPGTGLPSAEAMAYASRLLAGSIYRADGPRPSAPGPALGLRDLPDRPEEPDGQTARPPTATGSQFQPALITDEGVVRPLSEPRLVIGRGRIDGEVDRFPVRISTVSRRHCVVELVDGRHHCRDLGSSNGTVIRRGERMIEVGDRSVLLEDGDVICSLGGDERIATFRSGDSRWAR